MKSTSTLEGKAMTKEDSKSALKEFMLVQVEVIDRIARDCEYGSRIWRECDELLREYRLASASQPGKPVAWIASKGNETLHFSAHDGWDIQAVMTEPPPQAGPVSTSTVKMPSEFSTPHSTTKDLMQHSDAEPATGGSSDTPPHVPAAFINAIAEEGSKAEAIEYLQKEWNENCQLRRSLARKRELLEDAATRMERARSILKGPNENWAMLDTATIRRELETKP